MLAIVFAKCHHTRVNLMVKFQGEDWNKHDAGCYLSIYHCHN